MRDSVRSAERTRRPMGGEYASVLADHPRDNPAPGCRVLFERRGAARAAAGPRGGRPAASGRAQTAERAAAARAQPQAPAPAATQTSAGAARLQADAAAWERFKEGARREGRVVVVGPGFPGLRQAITEGFQNAY